MARVLVTGASGFIGRSLGPLLAAAHHQVRALVRRREDLGAGFDETVIAEALTDVDSIRAAVRGVDAVIHLAARVHVLDETAASPLDAFRRVNVNGTQVLFEEARRAGVGRFVFASSVKAVADWSDAPIEEETPPNPGDPYGISKVEAEDWLRSAAASGGPSTAIVRLPLLYGPRMKANMLRLFDAVAHGLPLPFGRVRNKRSLLYVGNFASAVEAVLSARWEGAESFLISDEEDVSTPELVRAIASALGRKPRLVPVPQRLFRLAGQVGDHLPSSLRFGVHTPNMRRLVGSLYVQPRRLRALTGWQPPHTLAEGLSATAEWYLARR